MLVAGGTTATVTTRTRGGGMGRLNLERESFGHVEQHVVDVMEDEASEDKEAPPVAAATSKAMAPHSRVIVKVAHLQRAFANYPCPTCRQPVELKVHTSCIASSIEY